MQVAGWLSIIPLKRDWSGNGLTFFLNLLKELKRNMGNLSLLKKLGECEYPGDFLVARLHGKKGGLLVSDSQ
jgi:hypothetical protein